jgi:prepilin-type processing-associated H-X9-DG protein
MTIAVRHLNERTRSALAAHFLGLSLKDRCLRFGTALAPTVIAAYVDGIDFERDAVFGVHDDRRALIGAAHVAFVDGSAELGLSVAAAHRRRGVGGALFKRAVTHARNRHMPRLSMNCLSGNAPIMRIATKFGMDIVAGQGDAGAHLELPPASPGSIAGEFTMDAFATCDRAFRALLGARKHPFRAQSQSAQ